LLLLLLLLLVVVVVVVVVVGVLPHGFESAKADFILHWCIHAPSRTVFRFQFTGETAVLHCLAWQVRMKLHEEACDVHATGSVQPIFWHQWPRHDEQYCPMR